MYVSSKRKGSHPKLWVFVAATLLIVAIGGVVGIRTWYTQNLQAVSTSKEIKYFTVIPGDGVHKIATGLYRANLIRNSRVFETYVRSSELHDKLQAGTYVLSPSMSVAEIVDKILKGDVAKDLMTILPAKRLDQIKEAFAKAGYGPAEIESAFNPKTYAGHPVLASLPPGASLEGYLYPESFQKLATTPAQVIVRQSLDEMQKHLTPQVINGFAAQGLNVFQGIILASIIAQETDDPKAQPTVAQIFLSRLKKDMPLGADATAKYASALAGQPLSVRIDSPYNTRIYKGLPPGPIGNVTADTLRALAAPAGTDYLFFVSGDDGKTYFSHTQEEHQRLIDQHCQKKCNY